MGFKGIYNKALVKTLAHQLVQELCHMALIFEVAKVGNVEFLIILLRSYPDLIWQQDESKMSIFHIAILCRHKTVFNLILEIGINKESIAPYCTFTSEDNLLHLAGQLPPLDRLNIVSGVALQMQ